MIKKTLCQALCAVVMLGFAANAIALSVPIDVMVVYPNDTSLSYAQRLQTTQGIRNALDNHFGGMDPVFSVTHVYSKMEYDHIGDSGEEMILELWTQNGNPQSWLRSYRDDINSGSGADLVIFVANSIPGACGGVANVGVTGTPPTQVLPTVSEDYFALIIERPITSSPCELDVGIAHEIGHLLYAEHEIDDDSNNSVTLPSPFNHAYEGVDARTIMHSYGPWNTDQWSGERPEFKTAVADNYEWLQTDSMLLTVAAYRPLPQTVANCNLVFEFAACNGTQGVGTATALLPGYSILNSDFDLRQSSGIWQDIYDGITSCPGVSIPQTLNTILRATLTTPQGVSECEIVIPIADCEGGGGPPNPW